MACDGKRAFVYVYGQNGLHVHKHMHVCQRVKPCCIHAWIRVSASRTWLRCLGFLGLGISDVLGGSRFREVEASVRFRLKAFPCPSKDLIVRALDPLWTQ